MRAVERKLRNLTAPGELDAQARAWEVAHAVYRERRVAPARRWRARLLLSPLVAVVAAVLALTPAGAAVHRWIDRTLGVKHARPALFSLPAQGQLLVAGHGGVWTIASDGSRRRLGPGSEATWSPHALYIAIARGDQLAAVNPRGVTQWSIARLQVRFPRWFAPSGYRLAYLSAGTLRVIAGDGSGDHALARGVAALAPAWRPGHPYELAYFTRRGTLIARDADSGAIAWSHSVPGSARLLEWSADGGRLLVLTRRAAFVYDGSGAVVARLGAAGAFDAALSPDGSHVALLDPSGLTLSDLAGRRQRLFAGTGLRQLAFSPDGKWLLVGWRAANQWVFLRADGHPRILAVSHIAQQFNSFPTIEGWCCTVGGGAS